MTDRLSCGFKIEYGNWTDYRELESHIEIDYHFQGEDNYMPYWEAMESVYNGAIEVLKKAYEEGIKYVIFTHGHSTSRIGVATTRSQIRKLMRGKDSTPYIIRKECIQHYSVFVAAIRPKPST